MTSSKTSKSRRMTRTITLILLLCACAVSTSASAQDAREVVGTKEAADAYLFGGLLADGVGGEAANATDETLPTFWGWELGGSVYPTRWLGVTGSLSRASRDDRHLHQYLAGARFSTSYSRHDAVRSFLHVLVGVASLNAIGVSDHGSAIVIGAGLDSYLIFRFQVDYMRLNVNNDLISKNGVRVFLGGVWPICFKRCTRTEQ